MAGADVSETISVRVCRGIPGQPPAYQEYRIPYAENLSVLEALIWVREHVDPSLAVRYSCRISNACKTCIACVGGRKVYLCATALKDGDVIEPLPGRPLLRDLVVDLH
jgi:succinate dehydrogenase/fumarate reductase-like Fe-S protein